MFRGGGDFNVGVPINMWFKAITEYKRFSKIDGRNPTRGYEGSEKEGNIYRKYL